MKILEIGTKEVKPKSEREYVRRCKMCGCKFTYKLKEERLSTYMDDIANIINCPQCGHTIQIWFRIPYIKL